MAKVVRFQNALQNIKTIHGRRGGSCLGYPPPEKFWVEIPPHREGYSLAKYSPPSEKFFPHPKNSPPKIWKKWQFLWIPPLNFVNFLGSPPWRRGLFGSLDSPPKKFSKSLPPDGLRCSPMYGQKYLMNWQEYPCIQTKNLNWKVVKGGRSENWAKQGQEFYFQSDANPLPFHKLSEHVQTFNLVDKSSRWLRNHLSTYTPRRQKCC